MSQPSSTIEKNKNCNTSDGFLLSALSALGIIVISEQRCMFNKEVIFLELSTNENHLQE